MQEVRGRQSRVFVWPGVHAEAGENIRVLAPGSTQAFILTDRNCAEIARRVSMSLQQQKFAVSGCVVPVGRGRRAPKTLQGITDRLARVKSPDAPCVIAAVGGTTVMHLASLVAARRGEDTPLFLVPTSTRAQFDSAVGGSGCSAQAEGGRPWHRPVAVFADPTVLPTLPLRSFLAGMAEAVKVAMVRDPELYEVLQKRGVEIRDRSPAALEEVVYRGLGAKAALAEGDEDGAEPAADLLEFGHTVGRAIEWVAGAAVFHGEALAVGMEAEASIAADRGLLDGEAREALSRLLRSFGLPTRVRGLSAERALEALRGDDDAGGITLALALPSGVGQVSEPSEVSDRQIFDALAAVSR